MNTNLLNIVNRIVAEQGEGILSDAKRLFPYFSDYAKNEHKEERVAFGRCIEMGAYQELKKTRTPDERLQVKAALATQMNAKTGVARPRCVDALDLLEAVIFKPQQQTYPQQQYSPQPQYPQQPSYPQQPQYPPQTQYPPQGTSPAGKKTKTNMGVWIGIAAAVVVIVLVVNNFSNKPSVQPKYTPRTGTASPAPSAPAPSSGGTAPAPAPSAPPSTGTTAQPQSPAPAQSNKAVVLWQTESVSVAKSEMYKLCNRFKYYETESYYGKSDFVRKYGNDWEFVYDVDSPFIMAQEIDAEVLVSGINSKEVFFVSFTNTNSNSYGITDSRDKTGIDGVLAGFDW
jgi:hypothetical protein